MTFAQRLRLALDFRGIKSSVLAYRLGVDRSTISNYANGRYEPKTDMVRKISNVLKVSFDWMTGLDVPMIEEAESNSSAPHLNESEKLMIALFRQLPPESQERAIPLIEAALRAVGLLQ